MVASMGREHVEAEVAIGATPDRMRMVRISLRVVVLDEQVRPVEPVVVRFARDQRTRPTEVDAIKRFRRPRQNPIGSVRLIRRDERMQRGSLAAGHVGGGQPARHSPDGDFARGHPRRIRSRLRRFGR